MNNNFERNIKDNAVCRAAKKYSVVAKKYGINIGGGGFPLCIKKKYFDGLMQTPIKGKDVAKAFMMERAAEYRHIWILISLTHAALVALTWVSFSHLEFWRFLFYVVNPSTLVAACGLPFFSNPIIAANFHSNRYEAFKRNRHLVDTLKILFFFFFIILCGEGIIYGMHSLVSNFNEIQKYLVDLVLIVIFIAASTLIAIRVAKRIKYSAIKKLLHVCNCRVREWQFSGDMATTD